MEINNEKSNAYSTPDGMKQSYSPLLRGMVKLAIMAILVIVSGLPVFGFFSGTHDAMDTLRRCLELVVTTLTLGIGAAIGYVLLNRFRLHGPLATVIGVVVTCAVSVALTKLLIWFIMLMFQSLGMILGILIAIAALMFTFISGWGLLLTVANLTSKAAVSGKVLTQTWINEIFGRKLGA